MRRPIVCFGKLLRIVGVFTKTPLGNYPTANTAGRANVTPFKPRPIPDDLRKIIREARVEKI